MGHEAREGAVRFVIKERLLSASDDAWIEDEHGNKAYRIDGKMLHLGKTAELQDAEGREVYTIKTKFGHLHHTVEVTAGGTSVARVQKALVSIHHKYEVELSDGRKLQIKGSLTARKFDIEGERPMAHGEYKRISAHETFVIEVFDPAEAPLMLALAVALDMAEETS